MDAGGGVRGGAGPNPVHAVLDGTLEMLGNPGFQLGTEHGHLGGGCLARASAALKALEAVTQGTDGGGSGEKIIPQLLDLPCQLTQMTVKLGQKTARGGRLVQMGGVWRSG